MLQTHSPQAVPERIGILLFGEDQKFLPGNAMALWLDSSADAGAVQLSRRFWDQL